MTQQRPRRRDRIAARRRELGVRPPVVWIRRLFCWSCGHEWTPRVPTPRYCPACHSGTWYVEREPSLDAPVVRAETDAYPIARADSILPQYAHDPDD